jgi:hypothetical protein
VTDQKEEAIKRLERLYKNLETKMTRDRYLTMCEQMGKEPVESEIPPDWQDFPELIQLAVTTFNILGDRAYPDIGYMGKDYTNLPHLLEIYGIEDKEYFLEVLHWLDSRAIQHSRETLKKEHEKLKRKK